jgi:hypothetical protein
VTVTPCDAVRNSDAEQNITAISSMVAAETDVVMEELVAIPSSSTEFAEQVSRAAASADSFDSEGAADCFVASDGVENATKHLLLEAIANEKVRSMFLIMADQT